MMICASMLLFGDLFIWFLFMHWVLFSLLGTYFIIYGFPLTSGSRTFSGMEVCMLTTDSSLQGGVYIYIYTYTPYTSGI